MDTSTNIQTPEIYLDLLTSIKIAWPISGHLSLYADTQSNIPAPGPIAKYPDQYLDNWTSILTAGLMS